MISSEQWQTIDLTLSLINPLPAKKYDFKSAINIKFKTMFLPMALTSGIGNPEISMVSTYTMKSKEKSIWLSLSPIRVTSIQFLLTSSPMKQTLRSGEEREWSPTKKAPDPVVWKADNTIQWINFYPVDKW